MAHNRKIAVIGLGHVGLPVAIAFVRAGTPVIGYDINKSRITELRAGKDRTGEIGGAELLHPGLTLTCAAAVLKRADFHIVTVPTPITEDCQPDLSMVLEASRTIGSGLSKGDIVTYKSTVYPGATEDECVPMLEKAAGLVNGPTWALVQGKRAGYSQFEGLRYRPRVRPE